MAMLDHAKTSLPTCSVTKCLEDVSFFDVAEVLQGDAAFHAAYDLAQVSLEAPQGGHSGFQALPARGRGADCLSAYPLL